MTKHVNPEFLKAFDHYQAMVKQYGDDHPITEQAFILTMHYTPEHIKKEIHQKAKTLNLLPPVSGYTDDGQAMYWLDDVAKHADISFEEAKQHLQRITDNSHKAGLPDDGIAFNSNININRVQ